MTESKQIIFHNACSNADIQSVKKLLKNKEVDPNKKKPGYWCCTPLNMACAKNRIAVVKLLLSDNRIDINNNCGTYGSPLYFACRRDRVDIVKLLLARPETNVTRMDFLIACKSGFIETIKILTKDLRTDCFFDENIWRFFSGERPEECTEIIKLLLMDIRIKSNMIDTYGTPLFKIACESKYIEIVKILLDHPKANKFITKGDICEDSIVCHRYVPTKECTKLLKILMKHPVTEALFDFVDLDKMFQYACMSNCVGVAKILMYDPRVDILATDPSSPYPLHYAGECGSTKIVRLLLSDSRISPLSPDNHGWTVFAYIVNGCHHYQKISDELIMLLLNHLYCQELINQNNKKKLLHYNLMHEYNLEYDIDESNRFTADYYNNVLVSYFNARIVPLISKENQIENNILLCRILLIIEINLFQ
jgi:ankyrin repeat protein